MKILTYACIRKEKVHPLVIQIFVGVHLITVRFGRQLAFSTENAPTKEEEILAGLQT